MLEWTPVEIGGALILTAARTFELRAALSLSKLYQATGRSAAAHELLGPAVAGFTEGPALPEVAEANRLFASFEQIFGAA